MGFHVSLGECNTRSRQVLSQGSRRLAAKPLPSSFVEEYSFVALGFAPAGLDP